MDTQESSRLIDRIVRELRGGRAAEPARDAPERLVEYFRARFAMELPDDLRRYVSTFPFVEDAEEGLLNPDGMVELSRDVEDWVTYTDEPHPCVVLAASYPGGPVCALWVDPELDLFPVVEFDHETSSERHLSVVGRHLGDFLVRYIESDGWPDELDVDIDLDPGEPEEWERRPDPGDTDELLDPDPLAMEPAELSGLITAALRKDVDVCRFRSIEAFLDSLSSTR